MFSVGYCVVIHGIFVTETAVATYCRDSAFAVVFETEIVFIALRRIENSDMADVCGGYLDRRVIYVASGRFVVCAKLCDLYCQELAP